MSTDTTTGTAWPTADQLHRSPAASPGLSRIIGGRRVILSDIEDAACDEVASVPPAPSNGVPRARLVVVPPPRSPATEPNRRRATARVALSSLTSAGLVR